MTRAYVGTAAWLLWQAWLRAVALTDRVLSCPLWAWTHDLAFPSLKETS